GFNGTGSRQLALEPLEVGLRGAVLKFTSNLGLLCLSPAAAHGGTPSRNNGAAQLTGGSDLCVIYCPANTLPCPASVRWQAHRLNARHPAAVPPRAARHRPRRVAASSPHRSLRAPLVGLRWSTTCPRGGLA